MDGSDAITPLPRPAEKPREANRRSATGEPRYRTVEQHRQRVLDQTVRGSIRLITGVMILVAGGLAAGNWALLPDGARVPMTVLSVLAAFLFTALFVATRRRPVPRRYAHAVTFALIAPILLLGSLRWLLTGELYTTTSLALYAISAGTLLLSRPWMILAMVLTVVFWLAVAFSLPYDPRVLQVGVLQAVVIMAGVMIHHLRVQSLDRIADLLAETEDQRYLLARQAKLDELTGVLNRRALMSVLGRKLRGAQRYGAPIAVLMIDLDNFKRINDTMGHAAGDKALQEFARRVMRALRETDVFGRYGGEEFTCIIPESDPKKAVQAAERIREEIARTPFAIEGDQVPITASIGVALLDPQVSWEPHVLLGLADRALMEAKALGRNRVVLSAKDESGVRDAEPISTV